MSDDDVPPEAVLTQEEISGILNTLAAFDQQITMVNVAKHNVCDSLRRRLEHDSGLTRSQARAIVQTIKARRDVGRREQTRAVVEALEPRLPFPAPFSQPSLTCATRARKAPHVALVA
jgi:hypothetical protein